MGFRVVQCMLLSALVVGSSLGQEGELDVRFSRDEDEVDIEVMDDSFEIKGLIAALQAENRELAEAVRRLAMAREAEAANDESEDWSNAPNEEEVDLDVIAQGGDSLPAATVTYTVLQLGTNGVLLFDFVRAHE